MKFIRTLAIAMLASILWGCDKTQNENTETPNESVVTPLPGKELYGQVRDSDGNPVKGVVVSDGFTCAVTTNNGVYRLARNPEAEFVYYSVPSEYEVPTEEGSSIVKFYEKLPAEQGEHRQDFILEKKSYETRFRMIVVGDPQVKSMASLERFKNETITAINETIGKSGNLPCYIISTGDNFESNHHDDGLYLANVKEVMGGTLCPFFVINGNHDKDAGKGDAATEHKDCFGPMNYSFNIGGAHFVCLDNIRFSNDTDYSTGFTDAQIEWLEQDLKTVSTSRILVLIMHAPLRSNFTNKDAFWSLLQSFGEVHIFAGHTHDNENVTLKTPKEIYQHVHGTACGAWWKSDICADGTPNGYAIYDFNGTQIEEWIYKATNHNEDFQLRLYRGDSSYGGAYGATYQFGLSEDYIVANVWNYDDAWKLEVYENGIKTGEMVPFVPNSSNAHGNGNYVYDSWAVGMHMSYLSGGWSLYDADCSHLFQYKLKDKNAQVKVVAIDRFRNRYEQTEILNTNEYDPGLTPKR